MILRDKVSEILINHPNAGHHVIARMLGKSGVASGNLRRVIKQLKDKNRGATSELEEQVAHYKRINSILSAELTKSRRAIRRLPIAPISKLKSRSESLRVIIPDSHGSSIDLAAAGAFLADLKRLDPSEIVMLGDHVDCGGFLAQHHVLGYVAQTDYSYSEDIAAANTFLDKIIQAAPRARIHYIEGNHERRIETWCVTQTLRHRKDSEMLRKHLAPEFMLQLKERGITYYRQSEFYHGMRIPGAIRLGKCNFWHGTSTAAHAASVNLSQFGGNVVYGHTHREDSHSSRPVSIGDIRAWNPGCLCIRQPLWLHTRPTGWNTGYGLQNTTRAGNFLHINIPVVDGTSLLMPLWNKN